MFLIIFALEIFGVKRLIKKIQCLERMMGECSDAKTGQKHAWKLIKKNTGVEINTVQRITGARNRAIHQLNHTVERTCIPPPPPKFDRGPK